MNTGYAMNPARDFAPSVFLFFAGNGSKVFTVSSCDFLVPCSRLSLAACSAPARTNCSSKCSIRPSSQAHMQYM
jgi:hypothetical protein